MAHMDADIKALAHLLRNPPAEWAVKPLPDAVIARQHVFKLDGTRPDERTVAKSVKRVQAAQGNSGTPRRVAQDNNR